MLTKLRVKNFKAWRDSGDIRLAPLTVLFGRNSAGKSSLGQLLLMLRQTATSNDMRRVLFLGDGDSLVDLGNYEDVVFGHDVKSALEFDLQWRPMYPRQLPMESRMSRPVHESVDEFGFHARVSEDAEKQLRLDEFSYDIGGGTSFSVRLEGAGYRFAFHNGRNGSDVSGPLGSVLNFHRFPPEAEAYYAETALLPDLSLSLDTFLHHVYHLGPLREAPRRIYWWTRGGEAHVGQRGERSIQRLVEGRQRRFSLAGEDERGLEETVAEHLKRMGLIDGFRVRPVAEGREQYEVLIRTSKHSVEVNLTDVGFGLSQLLPVLVECYCVPIGSTVLFEQPELHLHASAQAALADVFIDAVHSREGGWEKGVQFIIESHSEHFLTRLQRRIAEEKISASEVAMYFVDTEEGEAKLCDLGLDEFGNVQNWPEDFFGNNMDDLMGRTNAQYRRLAGGSK